MIMCSPKGSFSCKSYQTHFEIKGLAQSEDFSRKWLPIFPESQARGFIREVVRFSKNSSIVPKIEHFLVPVSTVSGNISPNIASLIEFSLEIDELRRKICRVRSETKQ